MRKFKYVGDYNRKNDGISKETFFRFFLLVILGDVFYFPVGYVDRFYTPGILWIGVVAGVVGILFPFLIGKSVRFSGWVFWAAVLSVIV